MGSTFRLVNDLKKIIKGCIAGKSDYQHSLYRLYSAKMYGVCLQYSKNTEEAKDILQDGFIKVFLNLKQFNFKGSFEGWIRRIMVNTAIERYRKKNYLYPVEDVIPYCENTTNDDVISELSANDILKLVNDLSPQYRIVFNLYAIEGYSHKEISEKLDISEGTSKSNLSRARGILQEKIKNCFDVKVKVG